MLSQPKPDKAARSKGAHGIDRGWMEGATGGKYAEQTIQESNHPSPFRFGDVLFGAFSTFSSFSVLHWSRGQMLSPLSQRWFIP